MMESREFSNLRLLWKMGQDMRVSGMRSLLREMAREFRYGLTGLSTKVTGEMTRLTAEGV